MMPPPLPPPPRLKTCSRCGEDKREREFNAKGQRRADGSMRIKAYCKACQAKRDRETRDEERRAKLRDYRKAYEDKVKSTFYSARANS